MATANTPHILKLPPELVLRVSSHLSTVELGAFRRCNKWIENVLFDSFAREFFTKRQFMLEQVSLEALVDIASHKTLSPYLSEVIISLDTFPARVTADDVVVGRRAAGHMERQVLLETGRAMELLVEAFSKLDNFRVLGLRDYEGRGRYREGQNARWRSYGWSSYLTDARKCEAELHHHGQPELGESPRRSILALLFAALDRAHAKPEAFEAFLRHHKLSLTALSALSSISGPTSALANLKRLMLNVDPYDDIVFDKQGTMYNGLMECIRLASSLQHLRINLAPRDHKSEIFTQWLCSSPGSPSASSIAPPQFSHLRSLDLGMFWAHPQSIVDVVCRLDLETLALWKMSLRCTDRNDFDADPDVWARLFAHLSKTLPASTRLRSISIGDASQILDHANTVAAIHRAEVHFANSVMVDENGERKWQGMSSQVSFKKRHGGDVHQWLQNLSLKTYIPYRHIPVNEDDSEDLNDNEDAASHNSEEEEDSDEDHVDAEDDDEEEADE